MPLFYFIHSDERALERSLVTRHLFKMKTSNNTILITGGARGTGLALAVAFVKKGNEVIVCGRRESVLQEAKLKLPQLHTKQADLANSDSRKELISWAIENFPNLNILVNNAGIQRELLLT